MAYFSDKEQKTEKIKHCILTLDVLKFLITLAWEAKTISHRHYEEVAIKLTEIGKMLGGWQRSLTNPEKKNRDL